MLAVGTHCMYPDQTLNIKRYIKNAEVKISNSKEQNKKWIQRR